MISSWQQFWVTILIRTVSRRSRKYLGFKYTASLKLRDHSFSTYATKGGGGSRAKAYAMRTRGEEMISKYVRKIKKSLFAYTVISLFARHFYPILLSGEKPNCYL